MISYVDLVLYLDAHQPRRLRRVPPKKLLRAEELLDEKLDKAVLERVAQTCYKPLLQLLVSEKGLRLALRLSGTLLEQMEAWRPDLLELVKALARKGKVELVASPYYNSVASLIDAGEFVEQVKQHFKLLIELVGVKPRVFANPFLLYSNEVAWLVGEELGLDVVIAEACPRILGWRAPSYVYRAPKSRVKLLLRDYRLSDEVAFGLSTGLQASDYAAKVSRIEGQVVLIGFPAETFGEFIPAGAGVFEFLKGLPRELSRYPWMRISTPSETAHRYEPVDELNVQEPVTWFEGKNVSALTESPLQAAALEILRELMGKALSSSMARAWRLLTQADILYSMKSDISAFMAFERAACALRSSLN